MTTGYSVAIKNKSLLEIIYDADIVVQVVMLILFLVSVWSWAIVIDKGFKLRSMRKKNRKFNKLCASGVSFTEIFEAIKKNISAPIEFAFVSMFNEFKAYNLDEIEQHSVERRQNIESRVESAMVHSKNKRISDLEGNLGHLATIASVSPFIGLFGTVWGIMRSFQAIALSKNTSLAVVAPGIAEALLATALGLVAAIPALVFYNILLGKVGKLEGVTDDTLIKFGSRVKSALKL